MRATETLNSYVTDAYCSGRLSDDEASCLTDEARSIECHYDPYGDMPERVSVWTQRNVRPVYLVNEYEVDRCYGGPEEGGWWYDHHTPTGKVIGMFRDEGEAYEVARHMNAFANAGRRPGYNTHRRDEPLDYKVESCIPHEPAGRPRYS